jgi:uncharacterized protein YdeI (YjbR/CyaY-like superfamily)
MNKFTKLNAAVADRASSLVQNAINNPGSSLKMLRKENALLGRALKFLNKVLKDATKAKDLSMLENFEIPEELKELFAEISDAQSSTESCSDVSPQS